MLIYMHIYTYIDIKKHIYIYNKKIMKSFVSKYFFVSTDFAKISMYLILYSSLYNCILVSGE